MATKTTTSRLTERQQLNRRLFSNAELQQVDQGQSPARFVRYTSEGAIVSQDGRELPAVLDTNGLVKPGQVVATSNEGGQLVIHAHQKMRFDAALEIQDDRFKKLQLLWRVSSDNGFKYYVGGFQERPVFIAERDVDLLTPIHLENHGLGRFTVGFIRRASAGGTATHNVWRSYRGSRMVSERQDLIAGAVIADNRTVVTAQTPTTVINSPSLGDLGPAGYYTDNSKQSANYGAISAGQLLQVSVSQGPGASQLFGGDNGSSETLDGMVIGDRIEGTPNQNIQLPTWDDTGATSFQNMALSESVGTIDRFTRPGTSGPVVVVRQENAYRVQGGLEILPGLSQPFDLRHEFVAGGDEIINTGDEAGQFNRLFTHRLLHSLDLSQALVIRYERNLTFESRANQIPSVEINDDTVVTDEAALIDSSGAIQSFGFADSEAAIEAMRPSDGTGTAHFEVTASISEFAEYMHLYQDRVYTFVPVTDRVNAWRPDSTEARTFKPDYYAPDRGATIIAAQYRP